VRGLLFVVAVAFAALWNWALPVPQASAVDPSLIKEQLAEIESIEALHARILLVEESDKEQYKEIDELKNKVATLEAKLADLSKPKAAPVVTPKAPVVSNGTHSQPDGYKSQWTYPGDIATHVSTVHGISTAGKTKEQLEREHDAAHNAIRSSPVVMSQPIVRYAPQSNCPNGQCPTKPSTTKTWSVVRRR